jgi:lambda family phage minor tail protein L|tara:strand:+ start:4228 stop:5397 length:1170 start_codon:yes stop_codon:yes gene_type:complete
MAENSEFKKQGPNGDFRAGSVEMSKSQAKTSSQKVQNEASKLEPSTLIELFEIDVSDILIGDKLEKTLKSDNSFNVNLKQHNIFRFHNNLTMTSTNIVFQGNTYIAMPVASAGYESNSKGTAATPKLSMAVKDDGVPEFKILKSLMKDLDDLVGARVTRIRTFAKFLDASNWSDQTDKILKAESDPDPYAFFPPDVYFVDRKSLETNTMMTLELASFINYEKLKIPQRILNARRCPWTYRGEGCCYENKALAESQGFGIHDDAELPTYAPPMATEGNQQFSKDNLVAGYDPYNNADTITASLWEQNKDYLAGSIVYITVKKVNYYFIAKTDGAPKNVPPPNSTYWLADQCSKTLDACNLRWGQGSPGGVWSSRNNYLPFGGFPGVTKRS